MACALLAVDFAACLLVLAKGRGDFPRGMIDEVVRSFRVDFDRHFGLTQDNAGNLLTLIESADAGADSTLGNIACRILEQSCSLANDEAQVWEPSLASLGDP